MMLQLESARLKLLALSYEQLLLLKDQRPWLEDQLGLRRSAIHLEGQPGFLEEFLDSVASFMLPGMKARPEAHAWHTHWLIVERATALTIGGIGAAGPPDEAGCVLIGYFIDSQSKRQGFATEAVRCFSSWLIARGATTVLADTHSDNTPSQRVLQKAGFRFDGLVEEGLRWKLDAPRTLV